jgi:hypothetical protein
MPKFRAPVLLDADPSKDLGAATKQYVDNNFAGTDIENTFSQEQTFSDDVTIASGKRIGLSDATARIEFASGEVAVKDATLSVQPKTSNYLRASTYYNVASICPNDNTGALKITLPESFAAGQYCEMTIKIQGWTTLASGVPYGQWELHIGCYVYGSNWSSNQSIQMIGFAPFDRVRFGYNESTGKPIIVLGLTSMTWRYSAVAITEVVAYHNRSAYYGTGWGMELVTSLSGHTISYEPTMALKTTRLAVGKPSTGLPSNDGDITAKNRVTSEVGQFGVGTLGTQYIGINPGTSKMSYYDGSSWHDFY